MCEGTLQNVFTFNRCFSVLLFFNILFKQVIYIFPALDFNTNNGHNGGHSIRAITAVLTIKGVKTKLNIAKNMAPMKQSQNRAKDDYVILMCARSLR